MISHAAHSNQGVCSVPVFASGGYSVTTACKDSSERPRMHCFAAAAYEHGLWHSPPLSLSEHALKDRRSVAVCVVGQPRSGIQTAPMIRRHVLDVLDADAFFVSQLKDGSEETKRALPSSGCLGHACGVRCMGQRRTCSRRD